MSDNNGVVHGKEYVYKGINSVGCSLMRKNLARLKQLLDGDITRSVDDDGTVNITINNQKP